MPSNLLVAIAAVAAIGLAPFVAVNYAREGSFDDAWERTINNIVGITATIVGIGLAFALGIWGIIEALLTTAPDVVATSIMGLVGYLSLADLVAVTPETWGILTIVAVGFVAYQRGS